MRIDHDRIGVLDPLPQPAKRRLDGGRSSVRGVDMHPKVLAAGDGADGRQRIDRGGGGRPQRGHNCARQRARGPIAGDRRFERVGFHPIRIVRWDLHDVIGTEAEGQSPFFDGGVSVLGAVHLQRREIASRHSSGADVEPQRVARGRECEKRIDRCGVVDDSEEAIRQTE